jgi:ABC-type multidrug transport system fused ATPase/permease subunit
MSLHTFSDQPPALPSRNLFVRVFRYCRRYPGYALATLGCAVASTLLGMAYPKLTGLIIDSVRPGGDGGALAWMALGLAGAFLGRDLFNGLRIVLNNTFEQLVIFDLRSDLYGVMQRLPVPWFDQRATGDLMTRVSEDVTSVERVLIDGIEQGVVAVLQIAGVGFLLFWINPTLALWSLVPIPFLVAGALWYTTTAHERYRVQRRAVSAMNALLLDNLQGVRQIKSFVRERRELEHFREKALAVKDGMLVVMKAWAVYSPSMSFLAAAGTVLVLYFGGLDVVSGKAFSHGELVTFMLYVGMFYEPVNRLHSLNQLVQAGRAAGERVFKIMDTEPEGAGAGRAVLPPRAGTGRAVRYEGVAFGYREGLPVLRGIDLEVPAGTTVALVGPTGAGKTTVVNLLPRFYECTAGRLTIDGVSVTDVPLEALRSEIGIVSQESFLFNASVRENLRFGRPEATEEEMWRALEAANARAFVEALPEKLETNVGERGVKLSVGEKQRLSIARALLKDPPILILDEATASVDTATEILIQQALERLMKNRTSFVIAHRLSTVRNAGLICVLEKGRIVEQGRHDELLGRGGLYARLCAAQSSGRTIEEVFEKMDEAGAPGQPR